MPRLAGIIDDHLPHSFGSGGSRQSLPVADRLGPLILEGGNLRMVQWERSGMDRSKKEIVPSEKREELESTKAVSSSLLSRRSPLAGNKQPELLASRIEQPMFQTPTY